MNYDYSSSGVSLEGGFFMITHHFKRLSHWSTTTEKQFLARLNYDKAEGPQQVQEVLTHVDFVCQHKAPPQDRNYRERRRRTASEDTRASSKSLVWSSDNKIATVSSTRAHGLLYTYKRDLTVHASKQ